MLFSKPLIFAKFLQDLSYRPLALMFGLLCPGVKRGDLAWALLLTADGFFSVAEVNGWRSSLVYAHARVLFQNHHTALQRYESIWDTRFWMKMMNMTNLLAFGKDEQIVFWFCGSLNHLFLKNSLLVRLWLSQLPFHCLICRVAQVKVTAA